MNAAHIRLVHRILDAAGHRDLPLWLGGGWAIDARLGRVTREHEDIDLTFPGERRDEFEALLASLGGRVTEEMDYGFLADVDGALLDCEPAQWNGRAYELEGVPEGSCPDAAEGVLGGRAVRCNSWDAILWDYFHYAAEVAQAEWPDRHVASYRLACAAVGVAKVEALRAAFARQHPKR